VKRVFAITGLTVKRGEAQIPVTGGSHGTTDAGREFIYARDV
jgi:hypothetical protein